MGLFGIFLDRIFFRPLSGQFFAAIIVCLGLVFIIEGGAAIVFTEKERGLSPFITGTVKILGATLGTERIIVIVAGALVMLGLFYFINRTKSGAALRAVAQDNETVDLQGVNFSYNGASRNLQTCGSFGLGIPPNPLQE